jgi:hypothetical protein
VLLLVVHLTAVAALTGLVWVVQLVVYPGFRTVGPTDAWPRFHDAHGRAIAAVVVVPWAVQGGTLGVLLLRRPAGVPLPLVLLAAALGLATVAVTVLSSVPLHSRLQPYDRARADRLLATNWLRTAAWTAGTVCAAAMVLLADG